MNMKSPTSPKRSFIGIIGFALVLVSPFTCYLTLIPGFICSIFGIKKKSFPLFSWIGSIIGSVYCLLIIVAILGVIMPDLPTWTPNPIHRTYANLIMKNFRQPHLPKSACDIKMSAGGLFAKHIILKFIAPHEEVIIFLKELKADSLLVIGDQDNEIKVITMEQKLRLLEESFDSQNRFDESKYIVFSPMNPWFTPHKIKRGRALEKDYDVETGIKAFYDEDTGVVYFYWHHS